MDVMAVIGTLLPDWGTAAQKALEILLPTLLLTQLLVHIECLNALAQAHAIYIRIHRYNTI